MCDLCLKNTLYWLRLIKPKHSEDHNKSSPTIASIGLKHPTFIFVKLSRRFCIKSWLKLSLPRINSFVMIGSWWSRTESRLTVIRFGNWHHCLISYLKTFFHVSLLLLNYKEAKDQQLFSTSHIKINSMGHINYIQTQRSSTMLNLK